MTSFADDHNNNMFEALGDSHNWISDEVDEDFAKVNSWFDTEDLRPIEEIPHPYQQVFAEYPGFNKIQSKIFDDVLYTDKSLVVSAPTGSGKTVVFELAIVRLLLAVENGDVSNLFKIVYISPMKALCEERLVDWHKKFANFGLNCISVTGDSDNVEFQDLFNHNLIITTPEKWDCLTRKWKDNKKLVQVIKLFMIDEVHLLNEESRGPSLETIVCRMKTIEESVKTQESDNLNHKIRFIALSATLANVEDIAEWIGKPPNVTHYKFSDEYRPVKLNKIVLGYPITKHSTPFKFDLFLNYKLQSLMKQYSKGKPTLIFCSTRKLVEMTAKHILSHLTFNLKPENKERLLNVSGTISDTKIKEALAHGVGYHHAGMLPETRRAIENLFRNSELPVLVTTSTLAVGVNLPAHLVIIKSTKTYSNGEFRDYTVSALLQMIGRAGRPQYDTDATALILTTEKDKPKFEKIIGGLEPIESNLHNHLTEHLNAEVVLETVTDLDVAMRWLSSTFLYIRAKKNPRHYGFALESSSEQIDKKLLEMCQIELNKLIKAGMLTIDQDTRLKPTPIGSLMAKYYLHFETMKLFTQMTGNEILQQILNLISKCHEFSEMYLRVNDKKCLNLLNKCRNRETIRFPLNGKIKTVDMKINCIIQAVLGCLDICDHSLLTETLKIMRNGERIVKCLIEYLQSKDKCYKALLNTIILAKCFHVKLWENSPYVSKQLTGIGPVMSSQLVNAGKTSFELIADCESREIELLINKKPPMGNKILEQVKHLPKYKVELERRDNKSLTLIFSLKNVLDLQEHLAVNRNSLMHLLVGDSSNNILLYEKYSHSYMIEHPDIIKLIDLKETNLEAVEAHFISEDWVGIDRSAKFEFVQKQKPKEVQYAKTPSKPKTKANKTEEITYMQKFMEMYTRYNENKNTVKGEKNDIKNSNDKTNVQETTKTEKIEKPKVIVHSNISINNNNCDVETENHEALKMSANEYKNFIEDFEFNSPVSTQKNNDTTAILDHNYNICKSKETIRDKFKFTPKKQSEKRSLLNDVIYSEKGQTPKKLKPDEPQNVDKKITWRSPIIYSPPVKFSPKTIPNKNNKNGKLQETPVRFSPRSPKIVPNKSNKMEKHQESETSSISNTTFQETTPRTAHSFLYTPLTKLKSVKVTASFFPLSDQQHCADSSADESNDSRYKIIDDLSDFIAPSVWENIGIPQLNQRKINYKNISSPTSNDYYKQLLSQPETKRYKDNKQIKERDNDVMSVSSLQSVASRQRENEKIVETPYQKTFEKDNAFERRQHLQDSQQSRHTNIDRPEKWQTIGEECLDQDKRFCKKPHLENLKQSNHSQFEQLRRPQMCYKENLSQTSNRERQRENEGIVDETPYQRSFGKENVFNRRQHLENAKQSHYTNIDDLDKSQRIVEECSEQDKRIYEKRYFEDLKQPNYSTFEKLRSPQVFNKENFFQTSKRPYGDQHPVLRKPHLERLRTEHFLYKNRDDDQCLEPKRRFDTLLPAPGTLHRSQDVYDGRDGIGSERVGLHSQPIYRNDLEYMTPRGQSVGKSFAADKFVYHQRHQKSSKPCTITRADSGERDLFSQNSSRNAMFLSQNSISDGNLERGGSRGAPSEFSLQDRQERKVSQLFERHLSFEDSAPFYINQGNKEKCEPSREPDGHHLYHHEDQRYDSSFKRPRDILQRNEDVDYYSRSYKSANRPREQDLESDSRMSSLNRSRSILPHRRDNMYSRNYKPMDRPRNEPMEYLRDSFNAYEEQLGRSDLQDVVSFDSRSYEFNDRSSQRTRDYFDNYQNSVTDINERKFPLRETNYENNFVTSTPKSSRLSPAKLFYRDVSNDVSLRENQKYYNNYCNNSDFPLSKHRKRPDYPIIQSENYVNPGDKRYLMGKFLDSLDEEQGDHFRF